MSAEKTKQISFKAKLIIAFFAVIVLILGFTAFNYYQRFFGPNVSGAQEFLFIKTGADFTDVYQTIKEQQLVRDTTTFLSTAQNMDYPGSVKPGRYRLEKGMSNRRFINMLKAGNQEPVKLAFQNVRLKQTLAGMVAKKLETDSSSLMQLLDSAAYLKQFGMDTNSVYSLFIPNSYEVYWNTSAEKFIERMHSEYQKFWNDDRIAKAKKINLTPVQVSVMASIVDAEALHDKEMPTIAGLYMNRYTRGIRLEADPTVIFANNDFTIRRVLNRHLRKVSPYNTYLNKGLPPGPITMPSINAIDAVLNYDAHNFIYMCAKDDFSGYHAFASTLSQHLINARKFQQALNERNIRK